MNDVVTAPAQHRTPRYERVARRIAYAAIVGAMGRVALACAAGYAVGRLAGLAGIDARLAAPVLALFSGCFVAHLAARGMSRIIGGSVARPIEMIVTHLAASGDDIIDQFHAPKGRRLDAGKLLADEAFLRARFAAAEERVRDMVEQLQEAKAQATLQNAAKSQFLAGMSHELRTPLNAILGYAMLLQEDALAAGDASATADLERIALAGRHLLKLINNVLELSHLETGKVALNRTPIDVKVLLAAVSNDVTNDLVPHGGTLSILPSNRVSILFGDQFKITQCLNNLVRYAAQVGPGREIRLGAAQAIGDSSAITAQFTVSVSGAEPMPAVPLDKLAKFEAFSSDLDPAALGLQIARHMARLMGGEIDLLNGPDAGLDLRLSIPLNVGGSHDEAARHQNEDASLQNPTLYGDPEASRCALVIDDNPEALDLMGRWLAKLGYAVAVAPDGDVGLALAAARKFDVIMLDVFMPGRSGYEVLEALRAASMTSETPVIMCTVDDDRGRALSAGATDHIRKPVSEAQLRQLLQTYGEPVTGDLLVIGGNDQSAEMLRGCAKQVGLATRRAASSTEGLALARVSRPNAIVFDLSSSRDDRIHELEALLADEALVGVPVVVLAGGEISPDTQHRIEQAGYRFLPQNAYFPREIADKLKELVA